MTAIDSWKTATRIFELAACDRAHELLEAARQEQGAGVLP